MNPRTRAYYVIFFCIIGYLLSYVCRIIYSLVYSDYYPIYLYSFFWTILVPSMLWEYCSLLGDPWRSLILWHLIVYVIPWIVIMKILWEIGRYFGIIEEKPPSSKGKGKGKGGWWK